VANTADFKNLVKELSMQVAAADPKYVRREDVPAAELDHERGIYRAQMENSGKPANVLDKIVEGKLNSFFERVVLLEQPSIRDQAVKVSDLVAQTVAAPAAGPQPVPADK
jgi:elongation factor Ts